MRTALALGTALVAVSVLLPAPAFAVRNFSIKNCIYNPPCVGCDPPSTHFTVKDPKTQEQSGNADLQYEDFLNVHCESHGTDHCLVKVDGFGEYKVYDRNVTFFYDQVKHKTLTMQHGTDWCGTQWSQ